MRYDVSLREVYGLLGSSCGYRRQVCRRTWPVAVVAARSDGCTRHGRSLATKASPQTRRAAERSISKQAEGGLSSAPAGPIRTRSAEPAPALKSSWVGGSKAAVGAGGILQPASPHKRIDSDPKHPELLTEAHSQRRMRRLLLGLVVGMGALGLFAFGDLPRPLKLEAPQSNEASTGEKLGGWELKKSLTAQENEMHRSHHQKPLSSQQLDGILRWEAAENLEPDVPGVVRHDSTRLASNFPTEDTYVQQKFSVPGRAHEWMAWGVFDGHAGSQVSGILEDSLVEYVRHELSQLVAFFAPPASPPSDAVATAIKRAFLVLDSDIMSPATAALADGSLSFAERVAALSPGYAGSCALLSLYDPASRTLRVACTGDSRAVLGRLEPDGSWTATDLSVDQNGENVSEYARLTAQHPDEPDIIEGKRLMGLAVTRAFGDGRWKWDRATQDAAHRAYNGPSVRPQLKTPPYLTAEPEVTATEVERGQPSFLIMASDGLWEHMSSQRAVELVGKWLEWNEKGRPEEDRARGKLPWFDFDREGRNVEDEWQTPEEWETVRDGNAATHLVRNALGGRNEDVLAAVLGLGPPLSRNVRDDTTVQVVFFGDGWGRRLPTGMA